MDVVNRNEHAQKNVKNKFFKSRAVCSKYTYMAFVFQHAFGGLNLPSDFSPKNHLFWGGDPGKVKKTYLTQLNKKVALFC